MLGLVIIGTLGARSLKVALRMRQKLSPPSQSGGVFGRHSSDGVMSERSSIDLSADRSLLLKNSGEGDLLRYLFAAVKHG